MNLTPARKQGESQEDYRIRRRRENEKVTKYLRGEPQLPFSARRKKLGKAETKRVKRERQKARHQEAA